MVDPFEQERQKVAEAHKEQIEGLHAQQLGAEERLQTEARSRIAALERQRHEMLKPLRAEEEMARRRMALGAPYVSRAEEIRRVEEEAQRIEREVESERERILKDLNEQVEKGRAQLKEWEAEAMAIIGAEETSWKATHVQLKTGDWVDKIEFESMELEQQAQLLERGVEGFNAWIESEREAWEAQHVKLDTDEWIPREDFESLSAEHQSQLRTLGVEGFNKGLEQQAATEQTAWEAEHVKLNTGEWVAKTDFQALTPLQQTQLVRLGVERFNIEQTKRSDVVAPRTQVVETQRVVEKQFELDNVQLKTGEWVSRDFYGSLTGIIRHGMRMDTYLNLHGVDAFNKMIAQIQRETQPHLREDGTIDVQSLRDAVGVSRAHELLQILGLSGPESRQALTEAAEHKTFVTVNVEIQPGVWVAKSEWGSLTPAQQQEVIATGQYAVERPATEADAHRAFIEMQAAGEISPEATFLSFDGSQIHYEIPSAPIELVPSGFVGPLQPHQVSVESMKAEGLIPAEAVNIRLEEGQVWYEMPVEYVKHPLEYLGVDVPDWMKTPAQTQEYLKQIYEMQQAEDFAWWVPQLASSPLMWLAYIPGYQKIPGLGAALETALMSGLGFGDVGYDPETDTYIPPPILFGKPLPVKTLTKVPPLLVKLIQPGTGGALVPFKATTTAVTKYVPPVPIKAPTPTPIKAPAPAPIVGPTPVQIFSMRDLQVVPATPALQAYVRGLAAKGATVTSPKPAPEVAKAFYQGTLPSYAEIIATGLPTPAQWRPTYSIPWQAAAAARLIVPTTYEQALEMARMSEAQWSQLAAQVSPALRHLSVGNQVAEYNRMMAVSATNAAQAASIQAFQQARNAGMTVSQANVKAIEAAQQALTTSLQGLTQHAVSAGLMSQTEAAQVVKTMTQPINASQIESILGAPLVTPTPTPTPSPAPAAAPSPAPAPASTPTAKLTPAALTPTSMPTPSKKPAKRKKPRPPFPADAELPKKRTPIAPTVAAGTLTWKMGFVWKHIEPPYTEKKPRTSLYPPVGAVNTHLRTPEETIQIINPTGREPESVSVDLGVTDIFIRTRPKLTIRFEGYGLESIVGKRISVPEKGLSIPKVISTKEVAMTTATKRRYRPGHPKETAAEVVKWTL